MKHIKTFESFSYSENEIIKEEFDFFGFGKPKDGEKLTDNIEENWELFKVGKLSKTSLEERFSDYGSSFGLGPDPKTGRYNMGGKYAPSVYNYLYNDGKVEDVKEDEFAIIHINRCKVVIKNEKGEWINDSLVGDNTSSPGRKM